MHPTHRDQPSRGLPAAQDPLAGLPDAFIERMQRLLDDEWAAFAASFARPYPAGLRVNTLKISPQAFQSVSPYLLSPIPWCPEGFGLSGEEAFDIPPGKHPFHAAGLYYLQEPSAMAVVELLDPQPGERILDLSAAPGGKSTHIAAHMEGQGVLVANEIHAGRAWELAENLERWGATNAIILNETPERLADFLPGWFDGVLLDAPCSGEGIFRKSLPARRDWSPAGVAACALRQDQILAQAARFVRPGGRLVYSTCTFAPQENEQVIARFLDTHPEFELQSVPAHPGFSPGRPEWQDMAQASHKLERAVRIWPHLAPAAGHFIAVLRRDSAPQPSTANRPARLPRPQAETLSLFNTFSRDHLSWRAQPERLAQEGSYLYSLPQGWEIPAGLKSLHPGRWLGSIKTGRFEPAHALALSIEPAQALRTAELDAAQARRYLRGEPLESSGDPGWILMTIEGFGLGWGKRVGGVIKNWLPKGLRQA